MMFYYHQTGWSISLALRLTPKPRRHGALAND